MQKTAIKFSPVNIEERKKIDVRPGDTVRVWTKIEEKGKTRLQTFEGLVLARKHGREPGATITVRKVSGGIGVERIFPLYSPNIDKIEVLKRSKTRRAKLYYIREKAAKEIRKKMKALAFLPPEPSPDETQGKEPEVEEPEMEEGAEVPTRLAEAPAKRAESVGKETAETKVKENAKN